jgi:hypothetical protein
VGLRKRYLIAAICILAFGANAAVAGASEVIDRNATCVTLEVNAKGEALVTWVRENANMSRTDMDPPKPKCTAAQLKAAQAKGELRRVLVQPNAVNAIHPTPGKKQVAFALDYSGGWKTHKTHYWEGFTSTCKPYRGEKLYWLVSACTAQDGSNWALQSWQRALPNYGHNPTAKQAVWELRLSHWTGDVGQLEIKLDWTKFHTRIYEHLFGTFTYNGKPVYGFKATSTGVPLDTFGRNLYVDTLDSAYGPGWKRENSFLAQRPNGGFCYGFYPHRKISGRDMAGTGKAYRATIIGPGVTPDVFWSAAAPGDYDVEVDALLNEEQAKLFAGSKFCQKE